MADTQSAPEHFTERGFWAKLRSFARAAGERVVHKALTLYYAYRSPDTPAWAKGVIAGALGYFVLPLDAVPDLLPAAGYTDDLGVLAAAVATVGAHVTAEHVQRATEQMRQWFGGPGPAVT